MARQWETYWRDVNTDIDPERDYTSAELEEIASAMLRWDVNTSYCPECQAEETDPRAEVSTCPAGHQWARETADRKGMDGANGPAVLFKEHLVSRRKREIYTQVGTPDPSVVSGLFRRSHPDGHNNAS